MDSFEFNSFEDILKKCGIPFDEYNKNANSKGHDKNPGCNDIPGGFQDLHPQLFVVICEVMGQIMAGNMPFNVQNSIGNWFELLGQVILTYSAQQQYFQNGPGRYYNRKYKNVGNPFCTTAPSTDNASDYGEECINYDSELKDLKDKINLLINEIEYLKDEIEDIKIGK